MLKKNAHYLEEPTLAKMPEIVHGFFTRNGGVSKGIYASLNTGPGSDDNPQHVAENRVRVAEVFAVEPAHLCTLYQVHGDRVLVLDAPLAKNERPEADAMVTDQPGLVLGILTADCAPVLFADPQAGVIGACHAGWKGAFANIMVNTVEAMESLGADRENILAVVGPCIAQASYEVDAGFRIRFLELDERNAAYFVPSDQRESHFHFDLTGFVSESLRESGVGLVKQLAKDTCFHENDFFSNRRRNLRGEPDYGRQISAIMLRGD